MREQFLSLKEKEFLQIRKQIAGLSGAVQASGSTIQYVKASGKGSKQEKTQSVLVEDEDLVLDEEEEESADLKIEETSDENAIQEIEEET